MAGSSENQSGGVPAWFVDVFVTAQNWWQDDDSRLLPGEEGATTVFLVEFADCCRYCGYTSEGVFSRLRELMGVLSTLGPMISRWNTVAGWFTWCAAWPAEWMREKLGLCGTCWSRRRLMHGPAVTVRPSSTPAVGCLGRWSERKSIWCNPSRD